MKSFHIYRKLSSHPSSQSNNPKPFDIPTHAIPQEQANYHEIKRSILDPVPNTQSHSQFRILQPLVPLFSISPFPVTSLPNLDLPVRRQPIPDPTPPPRLTHLPPRQILIHRPQRPTNIMILPRKPILALIAQRIRSIAPMAPVSKPIDRGLRVPLIGLDLPLPKVVRIRIQILRRIPQWPAIRLVLQ